MKLHLIEISTLKEILNQYSSGYVGVYAPQCTLIVVDGDKEHMGSIYLKDCGTVLNKGMPPHGAIV